MCKLHSVVGEAFNFLEMSANYSVLSIWTLIYLWQLMEQKSIIIFKVKKEILNYPSHVSFTGGTFSFLEMCVNCRVCHEYIFFGFFDVQTMEKVCDQYH